MDNCTCISREIVSIVYGNDFTIEAHVSVYDKDEGIYKLLDLTGVKKCQMSLVGTYRKVIGKDVAVSGSKVTAFFPGGSVGVGTYGVEITFVDSLGKGRIFERNLIGIVSASGEATVDNDIEGEAGEGLNVSVNVLTRTVRIGDVGSVLADYNLLENRPSIGGVTLEGNKRPSDLGMYSKEEADGKFETKESAAEADKRVQGMLDGKVDKEPGKGLSANDLTDERAGKVDMLAKDGRANEYLNGAGAYSRPVRQGYGVSVADDNTLSVDPQVIARQSDVANVAADLAAQKAKEQGDIDRANAAISKEETDRKAAVAALKTLTAGHTKSIEDLGIAKQDALVSGTNIKTINGVPVLGAGDIKTPAPTKVSELENDSGFLTEHQSLEGYYQKTEASLDHRVVAEAIVSLAARLDALEGSRGLLGDATAGTVDVRGLTRCRYPLVMLGHGVPAEANVPVNLPEGLPWDGVPVFVGQLYINLDATSGGLYYATGHDSVSDWKQA